MILNKKTTNFILACEQLYGKNAVVTRENIAKIITETGLPFPHWLVSKSEYRLDRGQYQVPSTEEEKQFEQLNYEPIMNMSAQVMHFRQPKMIDESTPAVPLIYNDYVPFGFHKDLVTVIKSKQFYPVFITGLSGNGKTLMAE